MPAMRKWAGQGLCAYALILHVGYMVIRMVKHMVALALVL